MGIPQTEQLEIDTHLLTHRILQYKQKLKEILEKYQTQTPDDIEKLIEEGKCEEHPAYEEYLEALSYKIELDAALNQLEQTFEKIKTL